MDTTGTPPPPAGAYGPPGSTPPQPGGSPPPPGGPAGPAPHAPRGSDSFFDSLRRMGVARSHERWIGGVAGGLARRFGIDPLIVRGAFVVLTLFGGLSLVLYGLAWALLPEESDGRIHLQEAIRGRFDAALAGAGAFVVFGITRPVFWFDPDRWAPGWFVVVAWLGLLATVGVIALIVSGVTKRPDAPTYPAAAPYPAGPPSSPAPTIGGETPMSTSTPGPNGTEPTPPAGAQPAQPPAYPSTAYQPPAYQSPAYQSTAPGSATPSADAPAAYGTPPYQPPAYGGPSYRPPGYGAPQPATPPVALRPRVDGPGSVAVGIVLALCLFAGAGILIAHRTGVFDGGPALTIAGVSLALLGLGVIVAGALGRRSGALGGIAVVVAVLAVPAALVSNAIGSWDPIVVSGDGGTAVGDASWTPTTVAQAEDGFGLGAGSARIDLTAVPLDGTSGPVEVPIQVGMGTTQVILPRDTPVEVRAQLGAGQITATYTGDWAPSAGTQSSAGSVPEESTTTGGTTGREITRTHLQGTNLDLVLRSPETGDATLVVTIDAGLGDVTIEESLR